MCVLMIRIICNMIRNLALALLLTLPTMAVAIDLEDYYITAKGGSSKLMDTGEMNWAHTRGTPFYLEDGDLGTGYTYCLSFGEVVTDNFRF